ncbi:MAG: FIST N-terminal domain-containing protein [Sulfurisoma sp.]|nr:FIST N-terminal domain-containing protein [Sulfurisoma sp.]
MRIEQLHWTTRNGWQPAVPALHDADLVLIFGATDRLEAARLDELRAFYPDARQFGCSTAGEILDARVYDESIAVTAVSFAATEVRLVSQAIVDSAASEAAGAALAAQLPRDGLRHVLVLSDGLHVNGTELVRGIKGGLPPEVEVTGGLSGDGARFGRTLVIADAPPRERLVAAVGFYGERFQVGHGSLGGWDPFGPSRLITRSEGNVLYELDGQSALALYKQYLGEHAAGLPATGLLFPLALRAEGENGSEADGLVRTILAVDEAGQSMTFAGDMPQGRYVRLMKANFDRLVEGAAGAARVASAAMKDAQLAVLVSCVGRKLVLKQRVEEEVEGVRDVLGAGARLTGFYSYGEISPYTPTARCELHNQTMTITTFSET